MGVSGCRCVVCMGVSGLGLGMWADVGAFIYICASMSVHTQSSFVCIHV